MPTSDKKTTQLPAAITPLTGTELVPIVQSGTTKQTTTKAIADIDRIPFTGDSGTGGTIGLVPAPTVSDVTQRRVLCADGTWRDPPSSTTSRTFTFLFGGTAILKRAVPRLFPTCSIG